MPSSTRARRHAAAVALVVFACAALAGLITRQPPLPVPAAKAQRIAASDAGVRPLIGGATRVEVLRVDDDLVKVAFYRGGRLLVLVGVRRAGTVMNVAYNDDHRIGYGTPGSHQPLVLGAFAVLFLLATLRGPLRRRRTLDALALAAFVVPTILLDRSWMGLGQALAAALLAWLVVSGALTAWRGAEVCPPEAPTLLERLARRLRQPRMVAQLGMGLLAITLLMTVTSTDVVDVALANMEGATVLLHGHLPYGHMPGDIVHGDTYGLPIYALYAPFAAIWPVRDSWDDATGSLVLGAIALVLVALGLTRATRGGRWTTVVAVLAFPPVLMTTTSGTNDLLVAAALVWAFAWFARPALSSALLAGAGLAKVAPLVLLPLWLARLRGAARRRAIAACAAVGAAVLAGLLALGGPHGPLDMVGAMAFQLGRRSEMSVWTVLDPRVLQPLVQAVVLAVALGGAALVALDRRVAADPRRVAGLVTAVLAGLQLAANHWMPLYLLWLLPPATVALLGPLGATAPAGTEPAAQLAGTGRARVGEPALTGA